jgi:uncharacterized protein (TIGR04141 family)
MTSTRLTVFLLNGINEFDDVLAPDKGHHVVAVDPASGLDGSFYYSSRPASAPGWVRFVTPILSEPLGEVKTSTASGLLAIRVDNRVFALTFGYGRSLLDLSKVEHQFGLKVALNRIDPRQIRSLDTKTFEDMVVTKNTQVSKSSELPTFGVDISRDILRAVTGEPRDQRFAKRLSGADSLVMNLDVLPADLPMLCSELLTAFGEDSYKADFEWIDHLSLVTEPALVEELNDQLVQQLRVLDTTVTHLAMPESVSWEDIDAFRIAGTRDTVYDDLDLDAYLAELGDRIADITLEKLKTRAVQVRFSRSGNFDKRWTLFQCLVSEQRVDGHLYVLIEGRWFSVSQSLVADVDTYLSGLTPSPTSLIDAQVAEPEAHYNQRLVEADPGRFLLLDAKIKRPGGAASGIELCDVLTSDGELIHVKRKSRSSTLSHLFSQGTVSASTFVGDGTFRDAIRETIEHDVADAQREVWLDLIPDTSTSVDRSRYGVTFAVIANSNREGTDWLPFFSKLNLMQHGKQLQNMGFDVAVTRVPVL